MWRTWLQAARQPSSTELRSALVAALGEVDPAPLSTWADPVSFTGAVGDSVDRAMYWQPPDEQDVIAAEPAIVHALRPVAAAIARAPGAQWWTTPLDADAQRYVSLHGTAAAAEPPETTSAARKLSEWRGTTVADDERARLERPADPAAPYGGAWWSAPADSGLPRTTRALPDGVAAEMLWEEDSLGQEAATVWSTRVRSGARIFEVTGPAAWLDLVRRYPLDVTWGRRHEWYQVTGRDGRWLVPDWQAVSQDFEAVHLTVLGYLRTATRALHVDAETATMLAGWSPDGAFWLTDAFELANPIPETWVKASGFGTAEAAWRRTSGDA